MFFVLRAAKVYQKMPKADANNEIHGELDPHISVLAKYLLHERLEFLPNSQR